MNAGTQHTHGIAWDTNTRESRWDLYANFYNLATPKDLLPEPNSKTYNIEVGYAGDFSATMFLLCGSAGEWTFHRMVLDRPSTQNFGRVTAQVAKEMVAACIQMEGNVQPAQESVGFDTALLDAYRAQDNLCAAKMAADIDAQILKEICK